MGDILLMLMGLFQRLISKRNMRRNYRNIDSNRERREGRV